MIATVFFPSYIAVSTIILCNLLAATLTEQMLGSAAARAQHRRGTAASHTE